MGQIDDLRRIQNAEGKAAAARIERAISDAMLQMADRYSRTGNPNPPDGMARGIGDMMADVWDRTIRQSGAVIDAEFKGDRDFDVKAGGDTMFDRIVQEFLAQYGGRKIQHIVTATRDQMVRLIAAGVKDGLGMQAIAANIREHVPQIAKLRATVIAQTETHTASMFASHETARHTRRPVVKEWVAVEDHRTRDFGESDGVVDAFSHRHMSGQRVAMDDVFMVPARDGTKEAMKFPGDPNGSAGNVIRCRCALTYRRAR